jgi:hypothetical protein
LPQFGDRLLELPVGRAYSWKVFVLETEMYGGYEVVRTASSVPPYRNVVIDRPSGGGIWTSRAQCAVSEPGPNEVGKDRNREQDDSSTVVTARPSRSPTSTTVPASSTYLPTSDTQSGSTSQLK